MKILIIEDEQDIAELIQYNFQSENWETLHAPTGRKGLELAQSSKPDLIVLDLMLPDISGLEICKTLKQNPTYKTTPVIMLTAKSEEIDRVVGFELGADDYITKPFSPRELVLRIKAISRRSGTQQGSPTPQRIVEFGSLHFDPEKYRVSVANQEIKLTSMEFKLLKYFLNNKGRVATREVLLNKIWGYHSDLTTRTIDTHVKRLREKLGQAGDYIETIRGVGYRFKETPA